MRTQKKLSFPEIFNFNKRRRLKLPLFVARVSAGFPSSADDFLDKKLDLNEFLVAHPAATFFVRAGGESMTGAGIQSGDILIVDRAINPSSGQVVIAVLNGELTVKRIIKKENKLMLEPANPKFAPIEITEDANFEVWGVVTYVIHNL